MFKRIVSYFRGKELATVMITNAQLKKENKQLRRDYVELAQEKDAIEGLKNLQLDELKGRLAMVTKAMPKAKEKLEGYTTYA